MHAVTKAPPHRCHGRGHGPRSNALSIDQRTRWRHPYNRENARPIEERIADRMCPQPPCKCGCGQGAIWRSARGRWGVYAPGHYRKNHPYKTEAWLREQYVARGRTLEEIAKECGVERSTVRKQALKFGITLRDRSESRIGRHMGELNPAWKGGVADWDYAAGWKAIARRIRDRDKWTCQGCGEQRKRWGHALHVHHIDEDKLNNDPTNLIALCAGCHTRIHRGGVI